MLILINTAYAIVGGMNIIVGIINKDFYQIITGILFICLLIDRLTIHDLKEVIKTKERNLR